MAADTGMARVLIVEDDEITRNLYEAVLVGAGFATEAVGSLADLQARINQERFDVILLDLRLPDGNALKLVSKLRSTTSAGIIVVTSSSEAADRLKGLESGADEYVEKPLHPRELIARVRNLATRLHEIVRPVPGSPVHCFEGWTVDLEARNICLETGAKIHLTENEFRLLDILIRSAPKPVSRDRLLAGLRHDGTVTARAVDKAIYRIRSKLQRIRGVMPLIETAHGLGYRLVDKQMNSTD
ncbi:response regulator transcription factor [Acetobacter sp. TBRC 12305]|uniref:Response regulator transcription factor n=1 Tax=Acetobacter garciniae TaxID=2817435 RepID=A0A939KRT1_9PROT|nr:response regulator transcription factor [Acetobacter garciniae]MBO1326096.1 response regulator transcription factor [Acetobacter garciniae]MBX0345159.1 response regulator transcription factor [Acetobacter garciniae]